MTEPRRLLDGAVSSGDGAEPEADLALELLRAGKEEEPSFESRRRAMTAAGLGAAVTLSSAGAVSTTGAVTTGAAAGQTSLAPAAAGAKAGTSLLVKWIGLATVGAVLIGSAWRLASPAPEPEEPARSGLAAAAVVSERIAGANPDRSDRTGEDAIDAAVASDARAVEPDEVDGDAAETAEAESARGREASRADAVPTMQATAERPAAPAAEGLVEEVAALDRARSAMEDDPAAALEELESYRERFAGGALGQEAEVLRIESLARVGDIEAARAAGQAFLARHPESPLAGRVRSVLASTGD